MTRLVTPACSFLSNYLNLNSMLGSSTNPILPNPEVKRLLSDRPQDQKYRPRDLVVARL